jgi:hypothetical protein
MFQKSDPDQVDLNIHRLYGYRGLYYVTYPQYAFDIPDSEQTIYISHAPKREGDNGILFWLAALREQGSASSEKKMHELLLKAAEFKQISEEEFNALVAEQCFGLIVKPQLSLNQSSKFVGALLMYSMETDLVDDHFAEYFAEYQDEYIHFYWHSTA